MSPVFPTSYFGSIAYYKELVKYSSILIETKEHFPKQTYRNRCNILSADGVLSLSIPVKKPNGSKTSLDDVLLAKEENWRIRHWRSIKTAYQSAPYFDYYGMEIEEILLTPHDTLLELNTDILHRVLKWLDIATSIHYTSEFAPPIKNDPRDVLVSKNASFDSIESPYIQVFPNGHEFNLGISILDAILCIGPMARNLLIER